MFTQEPAQRLKATMATMDDLPNELLCYVLRHVGCWTRTNVASLVCWHWRTLALDDASMGGRSCYEGRSSYKALTARMGKSGHADCLMRLHRAGRVHCESVCEAAAEGGHLHCLELLRALGYSVGPLTASSAFRHGRIDCLEYMLEQGCIGATRHSIDVLRAYGPTDCLGCISGEGNACGHALTKGHTRCLDYLVKNGTPLPAYACHLVAWHGHLECLTFVRERGCPWDEVACEQAAHAGHLECLEYMHTNGCPWDERTCRAAAETGRLACLQYAVEHGCPIDREGCIDVIERLDSRGGDCDRCFECGHCRQGCGDERRRVCLSFLQSLFSA